MLVSLINIANLVKGESIFKRFITDIALLLSLINIASLVKG